MIPDEPTNSAAPFAGGRAVTLSPDDIAPVERPPLPPRDDRSTRALAGLFLLLGSLAALAGTLRPWGSPRVVVDRWNDAARRGDIHALRYEPRFGSRAWAVALVRVLGEGDYQRVIRIYDRAEEAGRQALQRLADLVRTNGEAAWSELAYDRRHAIETESHREWVLTAGAPLVNEAAGEAASVWGQSPPPEALINRLGALRLDPDEQQLLGGRAASDPAVAGDAMLADLAAKRSREGARAFELIAERVGQQGERAFRRLGWREREAIDARSRNAFLRAEGLARLAPADRASLGDPAALDDEAAASRARERLGLGSLPPAERAEVSRMTRADFIARHEAYVETVGSRLAHDALVEAFGRADYDTHKARVKGLGGRDLLQRHDARIELRWTHVGGSRVTVPRVFDFTWSDDALGWRVSRVAWVSPATAQSAEDEDAPAATSEEP